MLVGDAEVDELEEKTEAERFQLNENKRKELHICFSKLSDPLEPIPQLT